MSHDNGDNVIPMDYWDHPSCRLQLVENDYGTYVDQPCMNLIHYYLVGGAITILKHIDQWEG